MTPLHAHRLPPAHLCYVTSEMTPRARGQNVWNLGEAQFRISGLSLSLRLVQGAVWNAPDGGRWASRSKVPFSRALAATTSETSRPFLPLPGSGVPCQGQGRGTWDKDRDGINEGSSETSQVSERDSAWRLALMTDRIKAR